MHSYYLRMDDLNNIVHDCSKQLGKDLSVFEASFMEKAILQRLSILNCKDFAAYSDYVRSNHSEPQLLLNSLHIGFSEFFRSPLTFSVLKEVILPSLIQWKIRTNKKSRIWSAACASGQEAYSLAILMEEAMLSQMELSSYQIFATDQDEAAISQARLGVYSEASIGNLSYTRFKKWIYADGKEFLIVDPLKKNIEFSVFDLLDPLSSAPPPSIFGDFDIVFCANLLYYYNEECRNRILEKIKVALADGGFLISSETERAILLNNQLKEVIPYSAIFRL